LEYLAQHIESLVFTTEHAISFDEIKSCLEETFETGFENEEIEAAIKFLKERYKESMFSFEIVEISDGYQFMTKGSYHQTIGTYLKQTTKKRLSRSAIETLSIIAYKQPVSKSEMEKIRGVSCDYSVQKLLEKELVTILGRSEGPGRPLVYGTTEKFMDYFGIKNLNELPKPKDFKAPDSEIGEVAPIEENIPFEENGHASDQEGQASFEEE
jgi:segregation and condensation protein B